MVRNKKLSIVTIVVSFLIFSCSGGIYSLDKCYQEIGEFGEKLFTDDYVWFANAYAQIVTSFTPYDEEYKTMVNYLLDAVYILDIADGPYSIEFDAVYEQREAISLSNFETHINLNMKNISDIYYLSPGNSLIDENYANPNANFIVKYNNEPYLYSVVVTFEYRQGEYEIIEPFYSSQWSNLVKIYQETGLEFNDIKYMVKKLNTLDRFKIFNKKFGKNFDEEFSLEKYTKSLENRKKILNDADYLFKTHPECLEISEFKNYPNRINSDYANIVYELNEVSYEDFSGPSGFDVPYYYSN